MVTVNYLHYKEHAVIAGTVTTVDIQFWKILDYLTAQNVMKTYLDISCEIFNRIS